MECLGDGPLRGGDGDEATSNLPVVCFTTGAVEAIGVEDPETACFVVSTGPLRGCASIVVDKLSDKVGRLGDEQVMRGVVGDGPRTTEGCIFLTVTSSLSTSRPWSAIEVSTILVSLPLVDA